MHFDHPNCIKLYERHMEYEDYIIMEMELGEESLCQYSKAYQDEFKKPLSEEHCVLIMKGLLQGIDYMHDV